MPNNITSNHDLVNSYDNNATVTAARVLSTTDTVDNEFACQCHAIETLRGLLASGLNNTDQWNAISDADWQAIQDAGWERAKLNINAKVASMTQSQRDQAGNIGGNYFERGYTAVMAGVQNSEKVTFTRQGDGV
jgi:hypothetical protein